MRNMGMTDRVVRLLTAVVIATAWRLGYLDGPAATALGIVALAVLVTSLVGVCPAYLPFHFSTRRRG